MSEIQREFDRQLNAYLDGCVCYQQEESRAETCIDCNTYCENYLDKLDLDEIEAMLKAQSEHHRDSKLFFKKFPKSKANSEERIRQLLDAIGRKA